MQSPLKGKGLGSPKQQSSKKQLQHQSPGALFRAPLFNGFLHHRDAYLSLIPTSHAGLPLAHRAPTRPVPRNLPPTPLQTHPVTVFGSAASDPSPFS